jgi:hypothetical protein
MHINDTQGTDDTTQQQVQLQQQQKAIDQGRQHSQ